MASKIDIELHYDSNESDFFEKVLGDSMTYSCADWGGMNNLEAAQYNKYQKIMRYARINSKTESVVDFGCGWGKNLQWMSQDFDTIKSIHGITISPGQARYIRSRINEKRITIIEDDIFHFLETCPDRSYDSAISVGSFEHLASPNDYRNNAHIDLYKKFFQGVRRCVKGHLALQTIVAMRSPNQLKGIERIRSVRFQYFISKYIFPNALTPTIDYIEQAIDGIYSIDKFEVRSDEYEKTIICWKENLRAHVNAIPKHQYDMFLRYFDLCIEHFGEGNLGLARYSLKPLYVLNGHPSSN